MAIISIMGSQGGMRNYTVAFCISWTLCGNKWSNEGESFMWSFDTSGNISSDSFEGLSGQGPLLTQVFQQFSLSDQYGTYSLSDRMWGGVGIIFSGLWQFSWIWAEKNQIPKNVANFPHSVDSVEHTAKALAWSFQRMVRPSCIAGAHILGNWWYVHRKQTMAGPSVLY